MELETKSWLAKNIMPLIALMTLTFVFSMLSFILLYNIPHERENIVFAVIGFLSSTATLILGFYFGSSHSSAKKDETIKSMMPSNEAVPNSVPPEITEEVEPKTEISDEQPAT